MHKSLLSSLRTSAIGSAIPHTPATFIMEQSGSRRRIANQITMEVAWVDTPDDQVWDMGICEKKGATYLQGAEDVRDTLQYYNNM